MSQLFFGWLLKQALVVCRSEPRTEALPIVLNLTSNRTTVFCSNLENIDLCATSHLKIQQNRSANLLECETLPPQVTGGGALEMTRAGLIRRITEVLAEVPKSRVVIHKHAMIGDLSSKVSPPTHKSVFTLTQLKRPPLLSKDLSTGLVSLQEYEQSQPVNIF